MLKYASVSRPESQEQPGIALKFWALKRQGGHRPCLFCFSFYPSELAVVQKEPLMYGHNLNIVFVP